MGDAPSSPYKTRAGPEFGPRPEATALKWDELLPTTQQALEELINWLDSACTRSQLEKRDAAPPSPESKAEGSEEQLATSVLVSGDRGYGKTTILLTTAYALRRPEEFLGLPSTAAALTGSSRQGPEPPLGEKEWREQRQQEQKVALLHKLRNLQSHLVWLDPLDMEPLPTQANLLATLLVRVRNALDRDHLREGRWAAPSLLEEGLEDPYGRIDKLVRDATFMWEDIAALGQDPRQRADQQIKAAEIYSTFRRDFIGAMERVSALLAVRRFGHETQERTLLVLPIDNVDRSIQHLHLILKLTRMVASRRLWFVLASGRSEFQLFLERTFQTELSSAGQARLGAKGLEETYSIARRQAAAAMRRVLPHVHRIRIEHVTAFETWRFQAAPSLMGGAPRPPRLACLLDELPLPRHQQATHGLKSLADLFDISKRLDGRALRDAAGQELGTEGEELLKAYRELQALEGNNDGPPEVTCASTERLPLEDRELLCKLVTAENTARLRDFLQQRGWLPAGTHTDKALKELGFSLLQDVLRQTRQRPPPILTYPARLALTLSARTALDLWQGAQSRNEQRLRHAREAREQEQTHSDDTCAECQELAIDLAESILRTSIDESELPGWASEQLHNRILRTNMRGRIVLDLTGKPVRRLKVTALSDVLEWNPPEHHQRTHPEGKDPLKGDSSLVRTELHLRHFQDDILELHDLEQPGRSVPLPPNVAGWFMVLHDLLVLTQEQRVLNISVTPYDTTPAMAVTLHTTQLEPIELVHLGFWWLPPNWDTFIDFAIFTTQWKAFIHHVRNLFTPKEDEAVDEAFTAHRFVFLAAAWIDNVCSVADEHRGGWPWKELERVVPARAPEQRDCGFSAHALSAYVDAVLGRVDELFQKARHASAYGRLGMAREWLDRCLPLLLHPEFLPAGCLDYPKQASEGQPRPVTLLKLWTEPLGTQRWSQSRAFIDATRRELVRKTVSDSELFRKLWRIYSGGTGDSLQLRAWLLEASNHWIALTQEQATWLKTRAEEARRSTPGGAPGT